MSYDRFRLSVGGGSKNQPMVKNRKGGSDPRNPKEFDAQKDFEKINKEFIRWCNHVQRQMPDVLVDGLNIIFIASQELVPQKTGALKRSGYVTNSRMGTRAYAEIGYAKGGHPTYALVVHEDLTKFHEPPTQAKYLEDAIYREWDDFKEFIAMATKDMAGF